MATTKTKRAPRTPSAEERAFLADPVLEYVGLYEEAADIVLASNVFAQLAHLDLSSGLSQADRDRIRAVFGERLRA